MLTKSAIVVENGVSGDSPSTKLVLNSKIKVLNASLQSLFVEVTIGALGKDFVAITSQPPLGKRETFTSHFGIGKG